MKQRDSIINEAINDALADIFRAYPDATIEDAKNGIADALTDLPITFNAARSQVSS